MPSTAERRRRFWRISTAGIFFQGGAAAVDTRTVIAALFHGLTGSTFAVGAAVGIARYGWLFPQLFVGYFAQKRERRLPFYMIGAFGRVACLAGVAGLLGFAGDQPGSSIIVLFFLLWTLYAFVSGIVAVPYNDIVARSIPSVRRSRLLATRFFGGGLLALGVAAAAHRILDILPSLSGYATVVLLGSALLFISAISFVSAGEPSLPQTPPLPASFTRFLRGGIDVFLYDRRFQLFLFVQWLGGAVAMASPFYILQVTSSNGSATDVAFLLGA